jgi:hypothetical protein
MAGEGFEALIPESVTHPADKMTAITNMAVFFIGLFPESLSCPFGYDRVI